MSDVESYTGKLVPVDMQGMTLEERCKSLCSAEELPSYSQNWLEQLHDEHYKEYHYSNTTNTLYKIEKEPFDPESVVNVEPGENGEYTFMVSFYNGGASLNEVLDEGIENTQA